jgi:hypothetical protein
MLSEEPSEFLLLLPHTDVYWFQVFKKSHQRERFHFPLMGTSCQNGGIMLNEFQLKLADLMGIVEKSAKIHKEYTVAFQKARDSLFALLSSPTELDGQYPYSRWMELYFELEGQFFGGTPQSAKLGADLENAVKYVIKSRFPDRVPKDFVESKIQHLFPLGRMEIVLEVNGQKTFIQVKRGFDSAIWNRILQEREAVEKEGNRYFLLSPTEYTNNAIRKELWDRHLWKWCFIWKERCWKGQCYDGWMERFLDAI